MCTLDVALRLQRLCDQHLATDGAPAGFLKYGDCRDLWAACMREMAREDSEGIYLFVPGETANGLTSADYLIIVVRYATLLAILDYSCTQLLWICVL
jgi:hypothetical protein